MDNWQAMEVVFQRWGLTDLPYLGLLVLLLTIRLSLMVVCYAHLHPLPRLRPLNRGDNVSLYTGETGTRIL